MNPEHRSLIRTARMPLPPSSPALGIGALSSATGIPVSTLRTWERRYGYPAAERTAGNHRLYPADTVERLLWVQRAMEVGHRASRVLPLRPAEIQQLLEPRRVVVSSPSSPSSGPPPAPVARGPGPDAGELRRWVTAVRALDESALHRELRVAWASMGTLRFIEERLAPFMVEVGELWATGALSVTEEHFASERVRDFLVAIWRPLSASQSSPVVLCATLPGEQHVLGLHMAACACALAGAHVVFLGQGAPISDIVACAVRAFASTVVVSVSQGMARAAARELCEELRRALPEGIGLVVGGSGAPSFDIGAQSSSLADLIALHGAAPVG